MRRIVISTLALALGVGACASQSTGPATPAGPEQALQALPRPLTAPEQEIIAAANAFSFALFDTVSAAQRNANVFLSPLSASFSLGMAMNGAASVTLDQMRSALQFGSASQQDINGGYKSLIPLLTGLDPQVTMRIANSVWYRQTLTFDQTFLDTVSADFNAKVAGLDFNNVPASLASINGWVDTATSGRIPTILTTIDTTNVMFLVNAIYFKGTWRTAFDPTKTRTSTFTAEGGAQQPVALMYREAPMNYAETATYQAVDLPYGDSAFTMTVVLPKPGVDIEGFAASLTPSSWSSLTSGFQTRKIDLYLPKLTLTYSRRLNPDLQSLGMVEPFDPNGAYFTGMSSQGNSLFISFVLQKTFVSIDEQGTEAAAATVTGISATAVELIPTMRVDRPYLIAIRERLSGTVLFIGKVVSMPAS